MHGGSLRLPGTTGAGRGLFLSHPRRRMARSSEEVAGVALALYRKYRPRTFAEVIGQEHVTEPLSQALRSGRLHHAYLRGSSSWTRWETRL